MPTPQASNQQTKSVGEKRSTLKRVLRFGYRKIILSTIPETRFGDKIFSYLLFVTKHKRLPSNETLFNDVLYRIKTTDEILDPLRVFVSDKEFVKLYVKAVVGDQYNVPTIDVIRNVEVVDDYEFPSNCCIKPTQASSRVILRRNGEQIDRQVIKDWFNMNFYRLGREANYKTLIPKVIIEPLIFNNANVNDCKFFCLNGIVKLIQVDVDRYIDHKRMLFDVDWNPMDFSIDYPKANTILQKPNNFNEMLDIARRLSAGFGFVRIDQYSDGTNCLVGEITNCPNNASASFIPKYSEKIASDIIFG